jgi:tetratricopeptide (TPR) repeat protein
MKRIRASPLLLGLLAGFCLEPIVVAETAPPPTVPVAVSSPSLTASSIAQNLEFEQQLETAIQQRVQGNYTLANQTLIDLLETNAAPDLQRRALLELAGVAQDNNEWIKAQQIYSQYIHRYTEATNVPEVLLRQGLLYRKMGVDVLADSKFYAVMSSALKLKLDDMDYYKKLVLQAQIEIAETYYLEGKYQEASEFFSRILKSDTPGADPEQIQLKLVRSLSYLTNHAETIASAQMFLEQYTNSPNTPEVRFLLASALKNVGRVRDSMKQVLLLLQSQQENIQKNPETWIYWQRRAGNEIANQFYKEGDFLEALEIYRSLAALDNSPAWQLPVMYQVGLVYEQLQQWQKAMETYDSITARQKEMSPTNASPTLTSLFEMAKWRKDYMVWMQKASAENLALFQTATNDTSRAAK